MPKFGQMTEESAIVEWLKKEGDKVDKGDILFTVETDKSVMEVESFEAGTLIKAGTGTLTLTGANTQNGGTTVNAGVLIASNRNGSATGNGTVNVKAGTLGGSDTEGCNGI